MRRKTKDPRPFATTALVAALAVVVASASPAADDASVLRFAEGDDVLMEMSLTALVQGCRVERVEVDDPYYERRMAFFACPLRELLQRGFGRSIDELATKHFFLRARDGYTRPADGAQLTEAGGYLAFADARLSPNPSGGASAIVARWQPIDRKQADPAPYYMIWAGPAQHDPHRYPWPYQLARIELAPFEDEFPHMQPIGAAEGSAAARGYTIFRQQCVSCHSINGEGGKVGPDLNVPRSIVEYRPARQIKAFVRDPESFRYTSMPSHRHLSDAQLDALVAYFRAMSQRKHDPP